MLYLSSYWLTITCLPPPDRRSRFEEEAPGPATAINDTAEDNPSPSDHAAQGVPNVRRGVAGKSNFANITGFVCLGGLMKGCVRTGLDFCTSRPV